MIRIRFTPEGALVLIFGTLVLSLLLGTFIAHRSNNKKLNKDVEETPTNEVEVANPCVLSTPKEMMYGRIVRSGGFFCYYQNYVVSYKGNDKETGEECPVDVSVTLSQYEYLMHRQSR